MLKAGLGHIGIFQNESESEGTALSPPPHTDLAAQGRMGGIHSMEKQEDKSCLQQTLPSTPSSSETQYNKINVNNDNPGQKETDELCLGNFVWEDRKLNSISQNDCHQKKHSDLNFAI